MGGKRSFRRGRAGLPPATTPGGISPDTMLPGRMWDRAPTDAPGNTVTRAPMTTSSPIQIGLASSDAAPAARSGESLSLTMQ